MDRLRLLVHIGDIDLNQIPFIIKLLSVFQPNGTAGHKNIDILTVKTIKPSERPSSIIIAQKADEAVQNDPTLCLMRLLAESINIALKCTAFVCPNYLIGEEINALAVSNNCNLILVPYDGENSDDGKIVKSVIKTAKKQSGGGASVAVLANKLELMCPRSRSASWKILAVVANFTDDDKVLNFVQRWFSFKGNNIEITLLNVTTSQIQNEAKTVSRSVHFEVAILKNILLNSNLEDCIISECYQGNYDLVILPASLNGDLTQNYLHQPWARLPVIPIGQSTSENSCCRRVHCIFKKFIRCPVTRTKSDQAQEILGTVGKKLFVRKDIRASLLVLH